MGTSPVGDAYQTVNTLPNVIYEVAAGGALAAIAVPLVAGQLGGGRREDSDRSASALLTWAVVILVPLAILVAVAAPWLSGLLLDDTVRPGSVALGTTMLRIFAPQVALYGIGVVLAGVLQAHRRFLDAAMAPLLSSVVVMAAYVGYGQVVDGVVGADEVGAGAVWVLAGGTTLGVVVLSLPLFVPVLRTGTRLRPTLTFPGGLGRRAAQLAGAGVLALAAQQVAVALCPVAHPCSAHPRHRCRQRLRLHPGRLPPSGMPSSRCPWRPRPSPPWPRRGGNRGHSGGVERSRDPGPQLRAIVLLNLRRRRGSPSRGPPGGRLFPSPSTVAATAPA